MEKHCENCKFSSHHTVYKLCPFNPDSPTFNGKKDCPSPNLPYYKPTKPAGITIREPNKDELKDFSNQPHYTAGSIEPWDYIIANKLDFLEGNVVKYITRYKHKGTPKQDLEKIKVYVNKILEGLDD